MSSKSAFIKLIPISLFVILGGLAFLSMNKGDVITTVTREVEDNKPVKIPPPIIVQPDRKPQSLEKADLKITTTQDKTHAFIVEVATTPDQQRMGMMYRMQAEPLTGMLFLFDEEKERSFWMKNTFISLDIIFIKKDGTIAHIHREAEPHNLSAIKSGEPVVAVLEIAGGEADKLGIKEGDRVSHGFFQEITE